MLRSLNTHTVGYVGLAIGTGSTIAAVAALFALLSNASYDVSLFLAIEHARQRTDSSADVMAFAQLVAAAFGIIGGFVTSLLAAYFGRPRTV